MIIGQTYVFLCVPRTASRAIAFHWLTPHYGGIDARPENHHSTDIPENDRCKFTWAIVRDPYARCASLWDFVRHDFRDQMEDFGNARSGAEFIRWCAGPARLRFPNQAEMLGRVRLDMALRYEGLPMILTVLLGVVYKLFPRVPDRFKVRIAVGLGLILGGVAIPIQPDPVTGNLIADFLLGGLMSGASAVGLCELQRTVSKPRG